MILRIHIIVIRFSFDTFAWLTEPLKISRYDINIFKLSSKICHRNSLLKISQLPEFYHIFYPKPKYNIHVLSKIENL